MILDAQGLPVDRNGNRMYPRLPLATYFANAGLSERDAIQLEAHIRQEARRRIAEKCRTDDADERRRYLRDRAHRERINREVIADILLGLGFSAEELRVVDQGMKLGLADRGHHRTTARVSGSHGEQTLSVESEDRGPGGQRYVVRDERTGERNVVG